MSLPSWARQIERNARVMGNCTAWMVELVARGEMCLVIIEDPTGARHNAALHKRPDRWRVGQINSGGTAASNRRSAPIGSQDCQFPREHAPLEQRPTVVALNVLQ